MCIPFLFFLLILRSARYGVWGQLSHGKGEEPLAVMVQPCFEPPTLPQLVFLLCRASSDGGRGGGHLVITVFSHGFGMVQLLLVCRLYINPVGPLNSMGADGCRIAICMRCNAIRSGRGKRMPFLATSTFLCCERGLPPMKWPPLTGTMETIDTEDRGETLAG